MTRTYRLGTTTDTETQEITAYYVTDITDDEFEREKKIDSKRNIQQQYTYASNEQIRPRVATFPVSQLYPADDQKARAETLITYMNKITEAAEEAMSQTALMDVLMKDMAEYKDEK